MVILKNDFKNIGNYLYLLFRYFFHSNPIYEVFGALRKVNNPHRQKYVDQCHAFVECTTTNTEVVQAF